MKVETLKQIKNIIKKFDNDSDIETHKALDEIRTVVDEDVLFKQGECTPESFRVVMHDLECILIPQTYVNKWHYKILEGNLRDIFLGKETEKQEDNQETFKCPNCNKDMKLEYEQRDITEMGIYDVYGCEDCCHILVLDYRG